LTAQSGGWIKFFQIGNICNGLGGHPLQKGARKMAVLMRKMALCFCPPVRYGFSYSA
jgi:hypothetical protein